MKLTIVDVFAEHPLAGNQLAVVRQASALTDAQMQTIALEMNFSETTFVTREAPGHATVRIFTPDHELPFAGHPTLGTAWVLAHDEGPYVLDLPAGPVPVVFDNGTVWMTPPPVTLNETLAPVQAAELIGLSSDDMDSRYPARFAEVGPEFILIGVNSLAALKKSKLNEAVHQRLLSEGLKVGSVFVFSEESYGPDADYACRMYFNAGGYREDPATGSANGAFAAYLRELQAQTHGGEPYEVIVDQGLEINRPSRIYLRIAETIEVGGKVQLVMKGQFALGIF